MTKATIAKTNPAELEELARRHLWLHFTRMGDFEDAPVPTIASGEGCYVYDTEGKRYLDGMAGMFCVQIGYSHGAEVGEAAAAQMEELPYFTNWSYAHPRAIELATEVAARAPGDLNRVFFVSGGAEAVESAWKLARQHFAERGERRWKVVSRHLAWHGTTMGALSINGMSAVRSAFEPLVPDVIRVRNTNRFRRPEDESEEQFTALLLDDLEQALIREVPETVAMVIMEPLQNLGGSLTPPAGYWAGVREICDRYGILLCADEVINGFGRLGSWFASERYDIRPDLITSAKGISSGYAPLGALIATDRVMEPFRGPEKMWLHGMTFGGHPVSCAVGLKNVEIMEREDIVGHVAGKQDDFRAALNRLLELPMVGDIRGDGFFYAVELVSDPETNASFTDEECEHVLRDFVSNKLYERGLICRTDDRADPVIQLSPPLIADQEQFDEIAGILGETLDEAWGVLQKHRAGAKG